MRGILGAPFRDSRSPLRCRCSQDGAGSNAANVSNAASNAAASNSASDGDKTPEESAEAGEGTDFNLRCFLAFAQLAANAPADRRQQVLIGSTYFLGRLDGGDPDLDLERRAEAATPDIEGDEGRALVRECAEVLERRGAQVTAIGRRISEREGAKPAQ